MEFLWHSLCIITRHELLPRIQALSIQRVVLADRLPVGYVQSLRQPDPSADPEPTDGSLRTEAGGIDPPRTPV